MTNKAKSQEARKAVKMQIKRISFWRRLGVPWKAIRKELGLNCDHKTLANHYHSRSLI